MCFQHRANSGVRMIYFNEQPFNHAGYDLVIKVRPPIMSIAQLCRLAAARNMMPADGPMDIAALERAFDAHLQGPHFNAILNFRQKLKLGRRETADLAQLFRRQVARWQTAGKQLDIYLADDDDHAWQHAITRTGAEGAQVGRERIQSDPVVRGVCGGAIAMR